MLHRFRQGSFLYQPGEILLNSLQAFFDQLGADFADNRRQARLRADLRNSGTHQSTPYDSDLLNRHSILTPRIGRTHGPGGKTAGKSVSKTAECSAPINNRASIWPLAP